MDTASGTLELTLLKRAGDQVLTGSLAHFNALNCHTAFLSLLATSEQLRCMHSVCGGGGWGGGGGGRGCPPKGPPNNGIGRCGWCAKRNITEGEDKEKNTQTKRLNHRMKDGKKNKALRPRIRVMCSCVTRGRRGDEGCIGTGGGTPPPPPGRPAYARPLSTRRHVPASMAFVTAPNRFGNLLQPPVLLPLGPPLRPIPFQYIPRGGGGGGGGDGHMCTAPFSHVAQRVDNPCACAARDRTVLPPRPREAGHMSASPPAQQPPPAAHLMSTADGPATLHIAIRGGPRTLT